jgi:hypothetical protein
MAGNSDKVGDANAIGQKSEKLAKAGCLALLDIEILENRTSVLKTIYKEQAFWYNKIA